MLRHHLQSAFANITRTPFTTAANILALALGLICFLAAHGIVTYWQSADKYHHDSDRIAFISYSINAPGATKPRMMNQWATPAMAPYLKQDFPDFAYVARANVTYNVAMAAGDKKFLANLASADPDFTNIFDLDFVEGNAATALANPNGLILDRDMARKLFGDRPALGQTVILAGKQDATITGVINPVRQPSFMGSKGMTMVFDAIQPWSAQPGAEQFDKLWVNLNGFTFVRLKAGASLDSVRERLPAFLKRHLPPAQAGTASLFVDAFPISRMRTLGIENQISPGDGVKLSAISLILGLGLLTLIVACVNYANLATAQSATRAKEVGMRKTLGARRISIMLQAWTETSILSLIAFVIAVGFLALAAPWVRANMGVDPLYVWTAGPTAIASIIGIVVLTAFVAGAYPAIRLSAARPAEALQAGRSRSGPRMISRVLVVIQFVSASFLLIMVTVMQEQRMEAERVALSNLEDPVAMLNPIGPLGIDFDTLEGRLKQSPAIKSVTVSDMGAWGYGIQALQLARSTDPAAAVPVFDYKNIGYDYFTTLNLRTVAGRVFDRNRDTVSAQLYTSPSSRTPPLVIDRLAATRLGFSSPQEAVGKIIYVPESLRRDAGLSALPVEIIGVIENEVSSMEASEVSGHVYSFAPKSPGPQFPIMRISRNDVPAAASHAKRVWDELAPNVPLNLQFYDQMFEQRYSTFTQFGQLFTLLAGTAFLISTVGLLGIAVHAASRRRHEIAVRKTLGSSTLGVVRLLLTDFSMPVLIGNLLAWPLAWIAAQTYLSAFAERINLTPAPFALSLAITLVVAWAAVIGVVLKAASLHPATVLRRA
ncbi:MAG TPA: ABC transporter permease [Hyphomonadaceae bacterium]|nr:ABC transporter permease [Hyphomonadaceae bacterium]